MVSTVYVLFVGTERQENTMEHPAVMAARVSSDAAYARVTFIPAGTRDAPVKKVVFRAISKWLSKPFQNGF